MQKLLKFTLYLLIGMCLATMAGCAAAEAFAKWVTGGDITVEDSDALNAGLNTLMALLRGDYGGVLYWGAAACGGTAVAGAKATKVAGNATMAGFKKVAEKRRVEKMARTFELDASEPPAEPPPDNSTGEAM